MSNIVGYWYEGAPHCPSCAMERFARQYAGAWHPRDEHGMPDYAENDKPAPRGEDGRGVQRMRAEWDDRLIDARCGTCGEPLVPARAHEGHTP